MFFFFFYRRLSEWESTEEERERGREGGSEEPGERSMSAAASPAGLAAQTLTTAFPGADAAAPEQAQTVAGLGGSWTGSPPLLPEAQLRVRVWWRGRSQSPIHSPPAWSRQGCTLRRMETCQDTRTWERGCWTWWRVQRGSPLWILLSTVKATTVGKNRDARVCCCGKHAGSGSWLPAAASLSMMVLVFFFFALRWVEVFQGCFFNMFQTQLPVQAASLPASCVFCQTLDASLGYIYVVVLVAWLGLILHCRETRLGECEIPLLCFYGCFRWVLIRIQSMTQIKVSFYMSTKDGCLTLMQNENLSCPYSSADVFLPPFLL